MTRKFNIIVDGVAHEVEVEELGGSAAPVSAPAAVQRPAAAPAPKAAPKKPAAPSVPADALELPPIQPVSAAPQQQAKPQVKAQETAELPPITPVGQSAVPVETIMDAIVESTSIELVINDITNNSVELPAIQPVR